MAGYANSETAVVLGRQGLVQYLAAGHPGADLREGRFFGVFPEKGVTRIRTDRTGQEQMFLFQIESFWAISNSFILLASYVAKSHRLTIYPPALFSFHLKSGRHIGEQLVSHNTPISGIRMIPATTNIAIDHKTGSLSLEHRDFFEVFGGAHYQDLLLEFLQSRVRLLATFGNFKRRMNLFLSGGYDSRVVLGMMLKSGVEEALDITSRETQTADFRAAKPLVEALGLQLNRDRERPASLASPLDSQRLWLLSCGGTYLPFYRVGSYLSDADATIKLTGDQPTSWDHFIGRAKFNGTAAKIADDIKDDLKDRAPGADVAADFLSVFSDIGVEPDHPKAMLAHYWAIRSRHHCGRHWYKSLGASRLVTPLTHSHWVSFEFSDNTASLSPKQAFADIFSALDIPELWHPFETRDHAFEPELLQNSPFKGGVALDNAPLSVFGDLTEPCDGPMSMMDLPVPAKSSDTEMKTQLAHTFWMAERARESGVFSEGDIARAKAEIAEDGPLSTSFRKVSHFAMTEAILAIVEGSGP